MLSRLFKILSIALICTVGAGVTTSYAQTNVKKRQKQIEKNHEKTAKETGAPVDDAGVAAESRSEHMAIQDKKVRKRMKKARKRANRNNKNKKKSGFLRWWNRVTTK